MHGSKQEACMHLEDSYSDAHTMAEMTESHEEDSSTLSTNALDAHFFLRGRRMWPLGRKSADPGVRRVERLKE